MLTSTSFVDHLPTDVMTWIAANAASRAIAAQGTLVSEGTKASDIYFIAAGTFEVSVATPAGGHQKISVLGPGAIVGEMSWLDGGPASASIVATEEAHVLALDSDTLDRKIAADPVFSSHFHRALAREAFARLRAGNLLLSKA